MHFSPQDKKILKIVYLFAKSRKVQLYLVGGILRDLILGRSKTGPDFDFCIKRGAIAFARALARRLGAGFVVLDKEHGAARVVHPVRDKASQTPDGRLRRPVSNGVKKSKYGFYTLDFTDFRGSALEDDLLHRDFSINSLALKLEDALSNKDLSGLLIDPYGGRQDLRLKLLEAVNKDAFIEDPLRILRAFSLSAQLGFKLSPRTLTLAKRERHKLPAVSGERIRDELFKIFEASDSAVYLEGLNDLKALEVIFPEIKRMRGIGQGPYHHLDVFEHTLETVRQLDRLLGHIRDKQISAYLNQPVSAGRSRGAFLKFAAFLHDIGKPDALRRKEGKIIFHGHERIGMDLAEGAARRLKLSNGEINSLRKIVLVHLRPGYLADSQSLTPRAKFRYFRDAGEEAPGVLLLSIADQRATKGPLTTKNSRLRHERTCLGLIREYFSKKEEEKKPRLLNGDLLMKRFNLEPSPLIGKILSEIEELQAIGRLKSAEDALKRAGKIIEKISPE